MSAIAQAVQDQWKSRAETLGYKPGSQKYLKAQAEFFTGAMTGIHYALGGTKDRSMHPEVPPHWVFSIMSSRDIITREKNK